MAEELNPVVFRKSPEIGVSYDYNDIIQGTGVIDFYGIRMILSDGSSTYRLIEKAVNTGSTGSFIGAKVSSHTDNPNATFTFDTNTFKIGKTIKGFASAIIPIHVYTTDITDVSMTITNLKLMKVAVGGATTDITNSVNLYVDSITLTGPVGTNTSKFVEWNEISSSLILPGEKIRLSLNITGTGNYWWLYHNPSGSSITFAYTPTITGIYTQLKVSIPFKLDL